MDCSNWETNMRRLPISSVRVSILLAAIAYSLAIQAPLFSQDQIASVPPQLVSPASESDLDRRVRELEAALRQMREQTATQPAAANAQSQLVAPELDAAGSATLSGVPPVVQVQAEQGSSPAFARALADQSTAGSPFFGWRDGGFYLESADRDFILRITGQIQADYREFLNS